MQVMPEQPTDSESFKARLAQLKTVERVVRPIRAAALGLGVLIEFTIGLPIWELRGMIRVLCASVLVIPADQFFLGLLYIKMRDSLWGVFGSRKSTTRVALIAAALMAVVIGS